MLRCCVLDRENFVEFSSGDILCVDVSGANAKGSVGCVYGEEIYILESGLHSSYPG